MAKRTTPVVAVASKPTIQEKNAAVIASMKASLETGQPVEDAKLVVEEEFGESPLPGLMDTINEAIQQVACEADAFAEDVRKKIERRANAYVVTNLVNQAFAQMMADPQHPLYILTQEYNELNTKVNNPNRISGGVRVMKAPQKAGVRFDLEELEKRIKRVKNVVSDTIAAAYEMTADEAFSIVREDRRLLEEQTKAHESAAKKQ